MIARYRWSYARVEMQESEGIRPFYKSKEFTKGVDWLFYKSTPLEDAYGN